MKFNTFSLFALGFLAAADAQQLVQKIKFVLERHLEYSTIRRNLIRCKKKCLNTKACQQIGFEFDFAEGKKKTGTCHLYKVQSKMLDVPEGKKIKCGKVMTKYVQTQTPEPTSMPSSEPSTSEPSKLHSTSPSSKPSRAHSNEPSPSPSTAPTLSQSPSEDPGCIDSTETFKVDGIRTQKSCDWALDFKCTFSEVIENCPVTCDICPTLSPSPTVQNQPREVVECSLEFKLAHKASPENLDYYGVHQDAMSVTKDGDNKYSCSGENEIYYPGVQASWCDYDSTYIDYDYYGATTYYMNYGEWGENPWQSDETIVVNNAAGSTYRINVKHIFQEEDHYYKYGIYYGELHYDHMMPAHLKVKNLNDNSLVKPVNGDYYENGWFHPVSTFESTHENGRPNKVNNEYQGNFEVAVTCDTSCSCSAEYQLV